MRFHMALNGAMRVKQILEDPPFPLKRSNAMSQQCSQPRGSAHIY